MHLAERFAIVGDHSRVRVVIAFAPEILHMLRQVIPVHLLELRRQIVRPVAAVFKAVVKLASDQVARKVGEGFVERRQICVHRGYREWIDHPSFIAGRRPLDLHPRWPLDELFQVLHDLCIRVVRLDPWTPKWPACAGGHVHAHAQPLGLFAGKAKHLHVLGREEVDVAILISPGPVQGRDLDAAKPMRRELFQLARQVRFIHRAAHPPPARPRLVLPRDRRPIRIRRVNRLGRHAWCYQRESENRRDQQN